MKEDKSEEFHKKFRLKNIKTLYEQRMEICHSCEEYKESTKQCKKCGCFMPVKSLLKFSKCPLKKWEK